MDSNLYNFTKEDFMNNYTYYRRIISLMASVDKKVPAGSCCGSNKEANIDNFIKNREKYLSRIEKTENRKIKPLWKGALFFSTAHKQINADILTDDDILQLVKSGMVSERHFDFSEYNKSIENNVEEKKTSEIEEKPIEIEAKTSKRGRKPKNLK